MKCRLDGSASLKILPYLHCVLVEGSLDFLVESLVLVVDGVNVIAV